MTSILGISAFYHDSAAALVVDGEIVAAAQEERFSRKKHDSGFPAMAIRYCLETAGLTPEAVDYVGFYDKPLLTFERLLETYLAYSPRGFASFLSAMPLWLKQKLHLHREIRCGMGDRRRRRYVYMNHHESHAASAFFPSPFEEAAVITVDGVGEWATATIGTGQGSRIELAQQLRFPHSLGLLYSAFTYYTGFTVNSGEYKVMGLAPYGEPAYKDLILAHLIDLKEDGSFRMDMSYFNYCQGLTMTSERFHRLFGGPPRKPDEELTQRHMDLAASIQAVTEEILLRMARHTHRLTGLTKLVMAGGVALNCVANGRLLREGPFEDMWIQPAAGDAGGSLGTALFIWHQLLGKPRIPKPDDSQRGSLLGPSYSDEQIHEFLKTVDATYSYLGDEELYDYASERLLEGNVVGWFQGRMEFGPRALGSRSLLGDPARPQMQRVMNVKVKFREGFRPFAPSVLRSDVNRYFEMKPNQDSPYMLLVAPVDARVRRPVSEEDARVRGIGKLKILRSEIPAVTHVDYSARVQTVDPHRHPAYHRLIEAFKAKSGRGVVVNTSFNLGWEPIVCSPRDAYKTFMSSDIDVLCMGHYVIAKAAQRAHVPAEVRRDAFDDLYCSPCCRAAIERADGFLRCAACGCAFPHDGEVPQLVWPRDLDETTGHVKAFYEEIPFPNYDSHKTIRSFLEKCRSGGYVHLLNESVPFNAYVLDVGCGTGQLTNYLGIGCRRVIGSDISLSSLRLAEAFRRSHGIARARFVQMNLFSPCFPSETFDVIICNGVLHHTPDPLAGLASIVSLLRPGGHIVLGLYNRFGRLMTDLRRRLLRLTRSRGARIDPLLKSDRLSRAQRRAWYADQYLHPHESKHTIAEVLRWFDSLGVTFVRGVPSVTASDGVPEEGGLFDPAPKGTLLDHALAQAKQIVTGSREGGFFIMIGRKAAPAAVPRCAVGVEDHAASPLESF